MSQIGHGGLTINRKLTAFFENEIRPRTGMDSDRFWSGLATVIDEYSGRNDDLLARRDTLQKLVDRWHVANDGQSVNPGDHRAFLEKIHYIVPEGPDFEIDTSGIDPEIATVAGPQLVVPITNARFATNAINARWGSLYDALYGTDALGDRPGEGGFDPGRGKRVIAWARGLLDRVFPLTEGSHADATSYRHGGNDLVITTATGNARLKDQDAYVGYAGNPDSPESIILKRNGLHVIVKIDHDHPVGRSDTAGVCDVRLESAVTTIMDCEDSVSMVDADDRIVAYRNWLHAMTGELSVRIDKGEGEFTRKIREDINIIGRDGNPVILKGRSLLLIRNAASHIHSDIVRNRDGHPVSESLIDAWFTVAIGAYDLLDSGLNSSRGSIYVVKPKMHGPDEVELCCDMFSRIEELLGLPRFTVKIGIMDEERRTTLNLKECIRQARNRVAFINTGFLDRTGDEIHTCMHAGPVMRKEEIKSAEWLAAYEDWNVDIGLACGLSGRAQIGKGMWAMPDLMKNMLEIKVQHPQAGASTAWVPSPTAAILHATHYLEINVRERQEAISRGGRRASMDSLLKIPLSPGAPWSDEEIEAELLNNLQGILGYVVRWVDQGIGCSKIPDINDVALMEDRATCRISSQHVANWLHHGIVSKEQVDAALKKMAAVVDEQNRNDPHYRNMADGFDGNAYAAASMLIHDGTVLPNGYTEWTLRDMRVKQKAAHPGLC